MYKYWLLFSHSVMSNSASPWTAASQASLSFPISWSLLKLMSIELVMPSNYLILCHPLQSFLPPVFPSIRVFSNELALCIKWSQCLELQHQRFQLISMLNTNIECLQICQLIYKLIFITILQMYCLLNKYLLSTIYVLCWTHSSKWERHGICYYGGSRLIVSVVPWWLIEVKQI